MPLDLRQRIFSRRHPLAHGCVRLLFALFFAFYTIYVPVHLVTEPHSHDFTVATADHGNRSNHVNADHDPDHPEHHEHHVPHPSAEHFDPIPVKFRVLAVSIPYLSTIPDFTIAAPPAGFAVPLLEPVCSLTDPPPEPSQPRAPPSV